MKSLDQAAVDSHADSPFGPLLNAALTTIFHDDELRRQSDLTVIGPIHPNGNPMFGESFTREQALAVRDDSLRVIQHCSSKPGLWDKCGISPPPPDPAHLEYEVQFGSCILVQTMVLSILHLATNGRMTPRRVWRLAMHQGFYDRHRPGFAGIDYGEVMVNGVQYPLLFPGMAWMNSQEFRLLEELGNIEAMRQVLINEGDLWLWMSPDRFPTESSLFGAAATTFLEPSSHPRPSCLSKVASLPLEVTIHLLSFADIPSILSLASTSRLFHTSIFGCDALVRTWVCVNAPWYIPYSNDAADIAAMDWAYLRRCYISPSMRNRRRIWRIVGDIERLASGLHV
ncbi:hypothetical protein BV22DRAFT_1011341 [Leucogyrophana mollusca]|uniref:Uncharacterized protein n=1 Tax=Leucogyrophana mollusca TaxID=85980 RepID=A0ACB8BLF3_9AGAM|nr:hypothetical protein BV22DRAFT_1011341 [Leucogyrophana mollusca]